MVEPSAEKELEEVRNRRVHKSQERKICEMDQQENERERYERKKSPGRSPPLQQIGDENKRPDFQEGLAQSVKEKKKPDPGKRLFEKKKVREAESGDAHENDAEIEVVDLVFFEKPAAEPCKKGSHENYFNRFETSFTRQDHGMLDASDGFRMRRADPFLIHPGLVFLP